MNEELGELLAMVAHGHILAEHTQPGCECQVETGFTPGGIRDCHWITVDTNGCPLHAGKSPWTRP